MYPSTPATTRSVPTRVTCDRVADRLTVVVDAVPAGIDDVAVAASSRRIRLRIDRDGIDRLERTVTPPAPYRVFTDDREAVYNNGVLTVSVGVARRSNR